MDKINLIKMLRQILVVENMEIKNCAIESLIETLVEGLNVEEKNSSGDEEE